MAAITAEMSSGAASTAAKRQRTSPSPVEVIVLDSSDDDDDGAPAARGEGGTSGDGPSPIQRLRVTQRMAADEELARRLQQEDDDAAGGATGGGDDGVESVAMDGEGARGSSAASSGSGGAGRRSGDSGGGGPGGAGRAGSGGGSFDTDEAMARDMQDREDRLAREQSDAAMAGSQQGQQAHSDVGGGSTQRPRCRHGERCYRRGNEAHRAEHSHPGDADWPAAAMADTSLGPGSAYAPVASAGAAAAAAGGGAVTVTAGGPPHHVQQWQGRLNPKHTYPQPLPGQTLTYRQKGAEQWETIISTEEYKQFPAMKPMQPQQIDVYRHRNADDKVLGVCLRNVDGQNGEVLAKHLVGAYGSNVLSGRGTDNNCSNALGETCTDCGDGFVKIWPVLGERAGQNHDGDRERDSVMLPFAAAAIEAADMTQEFPLLNDETRGSIQLLRFRAASGMPKDLQPGKRGKEGDRIHMHVDRDAAIGTVMLMGEPPPPPSPEISCLRAF